VELAVDVEANEFFQIWGWLGKLKVEQG